MLTTGRMEGLGLNNTDPFSAGEQRVKITPAALCPGTLSLGSAGTSSGCEQHTHTHTKPSAEGGRGELRWCCR